MRKVGSVLGNCAFDGMPGRPRLDDGGPSRSAALRPTARLRVADAQLVEQPVRERALIARRERPGGRVLRPERADRHDAAAIGQRRHRDEVLVESRQPAEDLIAVRRKLMIDPDAELILIDRLIVERADSCSRCRRWSAADSARAASRGDRIDAVGRDRVAGKLRARGAAAWIRVRSSPGRKSTARARRWPR